MTSSLDTRRQHIYNDGMASICAERPDSASMPGSLARQQSNQQNEAQMSKGEIEVKSSKQGGSEVEGQQLEAVASEGGNQRRVEALHQIRKDLRDTTGFGSYEAYLESIRRDPMYSGRSYKEIIDGWLDSYSISSPGVGIIDVLNEDNSPVRVSPRCEDLLASEIPGALCHPPAKTRAQIVLWPIHGYLGDIKDFLDVLGVGLQLDPCFFEALWWREDETRFIQHFRSRNSLCVRSIGTSVVVARSFVLAQDNPVPVVLIAGPMRTPLTIFYTDFSSQRAMYELVQSAPQYSHYT